MFNISNKNIDEAKIMAELLRSGNTMLNLACPVCNNPLFKNKDNKIFCPICKKQVIIQKENNSIEKSNIKSQIKVNVNASLSENKNFSNLNSIIEVLEKKINIIIQKLDEETQIKQIEWYIKILNDIFELIKKL